MSKITFRADDELIEELENFDVSKSEVMRRALRRYLENDPRADVNAVETDENANSDTIDALLADRIDAMIEERLDQTPSRRPPRDVNVNITLDGDSDAATEVEQDARKTDARESSDTRDAADDGRRTCGQCGENVDGEHVYCPNCGEKVSHRVFCECGDELRSDWAFCPSCGRRTAAADVLGDP